MTTDFNDLYTTRIGIIAESYVKQYLIDKKLKVYWQAEHGPHPFDGILFSSNTGYLIEVKAKYPGKYGDFSIHENDLEVYERYQKNENKQMLIFYVDHINNKVYMTTPNRIRSSTKSKWWDETEKKTCIFFGGFKVIGDLPDKVANEMRIISKKITQK